MAACLKSAPLALTQRLNILLGDAAMIPQALLLAQGLNINWYLVPMVAIISLSYTATHYEMRKVILERAPILFLKVMIFLGIIFGIIAFFSRGL